MMMISQETMSFLQPHHGRIFLNRESAVESTGHGSPMPYWCMVVRDAGGGEEMGGLEVRTLYARCAIQRHTYQYFCHNQQYQPGWKVYNRCSPSFQKHFEELEIGEHWFAQTYHH